jgi:hypothetical protein
VRALLRASSAPLLLLFVATRLASAQSELEPRVKPELRVDVTRIGSSYDVQGGGGVEIPLGYYTRVGVIGAAGTDVARSTQDLSGRLDVVARFLFDPFRQQRWGFSAGGGVSLHARARDHVRPYLVSVLDLEGPRGAHGISPAFQLGLGGGIRVGAALRWGLAQAR